MDLVTPKRNLGACVTTETKGALLSGTFLIDLPTCCDGKTTHSKTQQS